MLTLINEGMENADWIQNIIRKRAAEALADKSAPAGHPFYGNQHVHLSSGTFGGNAPKQIGAVPEDGKSKLEDGGTGEDLHDYPISDLISDWRGMLETFGKDDKDVAKYDKTINDLIEKDPTNAFMQLEKSIAPDEQQQESLNRKRAEMTNEVLANKGPFLPIENHPVGTVLIDVHGSLWQAYGKNKVVPYGKKPGGDYGKDFVTGSPEKASGNYAAVDRKKTEYIIDLGHASEKVTDRMAPIVDKIILARALALHGMHQRGENLGITNKSAPAGHSFYGNQWQKFDHSPQEKPEELAKSLYAQNAEAEPPVTEMLKKLSGDMGGEMIGLQYRLKEIGSLASKIARDAKEGKNVPSKAAAEIADGIRYTMQFPPDNLIAGAQKTIDALTASGNVVYKSKNSFPDDTAPYRGINIQFMTPNGSVAELQFHTAQSFKIKMSNHPFYEEWRAPGITKAKQNEITAKMVRTWANLVVPNNAASLKSFAIKNYVKKRRAGKL